MCVCYIYITCNIYIYYILYIYYVYIYIIYNVYIYMYYHYHYAYILYHTKNMIFGCIWKCVPTPKPAILVVETIQKTWDFKCLTKAEAIDIRTTTSCTHARSPVCRRRDGIKACLNPLCGFGWWLLHLQHKVQKGPGLTIVCCQHWNGSNRLKSIN